jgi:hypothetical protein
LLRRFFSVFRDFVSQRLNLRRNGGFFGCLRPIRRAEFLEIFETRDRQFRTRAVKIIHRRFDFQSRNVLPPPLPTRPAVLVRQLAAFQTSRLNVKRVIVRRGQIHFD